ncbi:DUF6804 family protein [Desertivirga arenae]|uniref:DUF6804 family protein n=1 Tax=Desertivirga arenae TaxID=2810309 RepID=UPI00350EF7B7
MGLVRRLPILFNPISPIYLYDKGIWRWIDGFVALIFIVRAFKDEGRTTIKG